MFFMIFSNEKTPLSALKTISSINLKIDIFLKELPMVLVIKWPFFQLFFLGNIVLENVFYDIIERKNAFLGYQSKKFKKSKS